MTRTALIAAVLSTLAATGAIADDQSEVQFQIQLGTSDLQNAENVRSQASVAAQKVKKTSK